MVSTGHSWVSFYSESFSVHLVNVTDCKSIAPNTSSQGVNSIDSNSRFASSSSASSPPVETNLRFASSSASSPPVETNLARSSDFLNNVADSSSRRTVLRMTDLIVSTYHVQAVRLEFVSSLVRFRVRLHCSREIRWFFRTLLELSLSLSIAPYWMTSLMGSN